MKVNSNRIKHLDAMASAELRAEIARQRTKGVTVTSLAKSLKWRRATLSNKLLGNTPITIGELLQVTEALGVDVMKIVSPIQSSKYDDMVA